MTTARQIWQAALTELSKINAPSLLLHEFNYYINKAISLYINKHYTIYDINLLTTDDLRVLKATTILPVASASDTYTAGFEQVTSNSLFEKIKERGGFLNATYEVELPEDYLHMLNCQCLYELLQTDLCYDKGTILNVSATRLTSDAWSKIINDYYNRPEPWRPYYFIHNVNLSKDVPTNPIKRPQGNLDIISGTDLTGDGYNQKGSLPNSKTTFPITNKYGPKENDTLEMDLTDNPAYTRLANPSKVRCEIRYGNDNSIYKLVGVMIDYIKAPLKVRLTKKLVDLTEDLSLIMEFPDYVCLEIINELIVLLMARTADPRLKVLTEVGYGTALLMQQLPLLQQNTST